MVNWSLMFIQTLNLLKYCIDCRPYGLYSHDQEKNY
jgi:hypothetical protein